MDEDLTGLSDDELQTRLDAACEERTRLEDERQAVRAQQIPNAELIAALEQEQTSRRKAGFLTGDIGNSN